MKLILIDGGPASGKNTLGKLLIDYFRNNRNKAILLDLDQYVEVLNPKWIWVNKKQKEKDQLNARINIAKDIDKYLQEDFIIIVIGERFLTKDDVGRFINKLEMTSSVYLYHLSVPFGLREQRLHQRGPHSIIDLEKDQKERDAIKIWPGYIYGNINSSKEDAEKLYKLIQDNKGLLNLSEIKLNS